MQGRWLRWKVDGMPPGPAPSQRLVRRLVDAQLDRELLTLGERGPFAAQADGDDEAAVGGDGDACRVIPELYGAGPLGHRDQVGGQPQCGDEIF